MDGIGEDSDNAHRNYVSYTSTLQRVALTHGISHLQSEIRLHAGFESCDIRHMGNKLGSIDHTDIIIMISSKFSI